MVDVEAGTYQNIRSIRCADDSHARQLLHAIHLVQQTREHAGMAGTLLTVTRGS